MILPAFPRCRMIRPRCSECLPTAVITQTDRGRPPGKRHAARYSGTKITRKLSNTTSVPIEPAATLRSCLVVSKTDAAFLHATIDVRPSSVPPSVSSRLLSSDSYQRDLNLATDASLHPKIHSSQFSFFRPTGSAIASSNAIVIPANINLTASTTQSFENDQAYFSVGECDVARSGTLLQKERSDFGSALDVVPRTKSEILVLISKAGSSRRRRCFL